MQWDEAIAVAEARSHPDLESMRNNYTDWLLSTSQEEKAGELRESEGDLQGALNFFMKAGLPGRYGSCLAEACGQAHSLFSCRAAQLIMRHPDLSSRADLVERVASALMQASVYDRAGELFEKVQMPQRALEAYKQGKAFAKAVDLARGAFPDEVNPAPSACACPSLIDTRL